MRTVLVAGVAVVLAVALGSTGTAAGPLGRSDVAMVARGTDAAGEAMDMACELAFVVVPSNVFAGACRVRVGGDELTVSGTADDDNTPTLVLNGRVTIRGVASAGTGRFAALAVDGSLRFPVDIAVDPLARTWSIHGERAGGGSHTVGAGELTSGRLVFALP